MVKQLKLSDQVRKALKDSGRSQLSIERSTRRRISRFCLSRFLKGHGMTLRRLDVLAKELDLIVVPREQLKSGSRKPANV